MVKNINIKAFIKKDKMKKHEEGFIAQNVKPVLPDKYGVVNDEG